MALGSIFAGWGFYDWFVGSDWQRFWGNSIYIADIHTALDDAHHVPLWVKLLPLFVAIMGIVLAYFIYDGRRPYAENLAKKLAPLYRFSLHKWYFDEAYDRVFVKPGFSRWSVILETR